MNIEIWIAILKQNPEAKHSFLNYLQDHISNSSKKFKTASSMDQVSKIQGEIQALELILKDFNRDQLQEQEHATYESYRKRTEAGT